MSRILTLILPLLCCLPLYGQGVAEADPDTEVADADFDPELTGLSLDWQEQILQQIDADAYDEAAYSDLLEELSELVVWSDTAQYAALNGNRLRHRIITTSNRCLNQRAGYVNPTPDRRAAGKAYLGDAWHQSVRYRMQYGSDWQAGLNLEKDAGEAWRQQFPLFDSWHLYVRYKPAKRISHHLQQQRQRTGLQLTDAVIGHYRLRMGCGLVLNQGFSLGKQYMSQQMFGQRTNVITPFASNAEAGYMQGAAVSLRWGRHLTLMPYFSAVQRDGTLNGQRILTAMQTDGNHRTQTEDSHRQAAWMWTSGARLGWRGEWYDVGLHTVYTHLQYDFVRPYNYYNTHYFRGHQLTQCALDYTARALGGQMRGELAIDDRGAIASITALQYALGDYCQTSLMYRYYDSHYRQLQASALRESSGMQGEQGVTAQVEAQLSRSWQLQGMADWFGFAQPQYSIRDTASHGFEASVRALYSHRNSRFTLGYRIKQKADYRRHTLDAVLTLQPLASLTCRTQLRARMYNKEETADKEKVNGTNGQSRGYAVSQAVGWQCRYWPRCPWVIEGQACYFRTDDYDSRLYLTERTILYGFGLPMLYGEGVRYSLTSTIKIGPHVNVDLKWALTNYANRATIGSGLQQIAGNTQQDVWLQLRLSL